MVETLLVLWIRVYLQLSICGLSMARPLSLLICIFFLGDTGDGDVLLSPSPSTGGYWSQLIQHHDQLDSGRKAKARGGRVGALVWTGSFGLNWQLRCYQGPVVWLRWSSVVAAAAFIIWGSLFGALRYAHGCKSCLADHTLLQLNYALNPYGCGLCNCFHLRMCTALMGNLAQAGYCLCMNYHVYTVVSQVSTNVLHFKGPL